MLWLSGWGGELANRAPHGAGPVVVVLGALDLDRVAATDTARNPPKVDSGR